VLQWHKYGDYLIIAASCFTGRRQPHGFHASAKGDIPTCFFVSCQFLNPCYVEIDRGEKTQVTSSEFKTIPTVQVKQVSNFFFKKKYMAPELEPLIFVLVQKF
jgi:hypothetical protein